MEKEADEEFPGSLCTNEVDRFKDITSKDSFGFYFGKKVSGCGGVEEVKGDVEDGILFINFANEEIK